ncbi:MAG: serine protease [Acidobacteria bacterium]|nr:serine protease [Acidobacteriota bacterium]
MASIKELIQSLEGVRRSRIICYFTGDRTNQEIQIGDDVLPCFSRHLSDIGKSEKLDLVLYSRGGNTLTGFTLANALREFSDNVNVLVPFRAHSCATLIALSANAVIAGPFAQLSPIDPSITTPHGPTIQQGGENKFIPVSVDDVANFFQLAKQEAGLKEEAHMASVLGHLCQRVSPLALGAVYRAREQIGMLAKKLLALHMADNEKIEKIVKQLTRELLSHDYLIGRREARHMGLPVTDATSQEADLMWQIYECVAADLKLSEPLMWEKEAPSSGSKTVTNARGLLESRNVKHVFSSIYQVKRVTISQGGGKKSEELQITVTEESWKKV